MELEKDMTLTEQIMNYHGGVINNPYQGTDKKVLFVCSAGILRSATAARLYAKRFNTRCCGTMDCALIPISPTLILWADEVVFVNRENKVYAYDFLNLGKYLDQKVVKTLNIPDQHEHMSPALLRAFHEQYDWVF